MKPRALSVRAKEMGIDEETVDAAMDADAQNTSESLDEAFGLDEVQLARRVGRRALNEMKSGAEILPPKTKP